jgi:hypothetical protein
MLKRTNMKSKCRKAVRAAWWENESPSCWNSSLLSTTAPSTLHTLPILMVDAIIYELKEIQAVTDPYIRTMKIPSTS